MKESRSNEAEGAAATTGHQLARPGTSMMEPTASMLTDRIVERIDEFSLWQCAEGASTAAQENLLFYLNDLCRFDRDLGLKLVRALEARYAADSQVGPWLGHYVRDVIESGAKSLVDDIQILYFDWPVSDIRQWLKDHGEPVPTRGPLGHHQLDRFRTWSRSEALREFEEEKAAFT